MYDKEAAAYKLKVNKIMVNYNAGRLPDTPFINSFMPRVYKLVNTEGSRPLSDREKEVIDELFDT